jgi:hypothetical protein
MLAHFRNSWLPSSSCSGQWHLRPGRSLHPNSLHYRLRRIAEITGRDPPTLASLLELIAAARLAAPQAAGRPD